MQNCTRDVPRSAGGSAVALPPQTGVWGPRPRAGSGAVTAAPSAVVGEDLGPAADIQHLHLVTPQRHAVLWPREGQTTPVFPAN